MGLDFFSTMNLSLLANADAAVGAGIFGGMICCAAIPGLLFFGFWLWMLIDCATKEFDNNDKLIWILIIIFTGGIGALIYFFVARPKGRKPGQTPSQ